MGRLFKSHLTVALTEEAYSRMKEYPEIKWGAIARRAVVKHLDELDRMREMMADKILESGRYFKLSNSKTFEK